MRNKFVLLFILFAISAAVPIQAQVKATSEVFNRTMQKLQKAHALQYNVETNYSYRGENKTMRSFFKQKKLSYDPYAGYSFYKEIDEDIKIYYHFLKLGVVEENKNMLSVFDHKEDPSFSRYVDSYSKDLENLWWVLEIMERSKDIFSFETAEVIRGKEYYNYSLKNYSLWIDIKTELPYKIESLSQNGSTIVRVFSDIQLNKVFEESTFLYPENEGYVVVHRKANPEPLVNTAAPLWSLKDTYGKTVNLSDYKGKPLFIEAWSADCNFCIASFPTIKEIQQTFGKQVEVITVNMDYDVEKAKQAMEEYQLDFTVLEGDAGFYRDYLIRSFPSYYVIDAAGKIILHEKGAIRNQAKVKLWQTLEEVSKNQ